MSVKVATPRDIGSSFNSSIPTPDASTGEVEWESYEDRRFLVDLPKPDGYNYSNCFVYVPDWGYYVAFRSDSDVRDWIIVRFDNDMNIINQASAVVPPECHRVASLHAGGYGIRVIYSGRQDGATTIKTQLANMYVQFIGWDYDGVSDLPSEIVNSQSATIEVWSDLTGFVVYLSDRQPGEESTYSLFKLNRQGSLIKKINLIDAATICKGENQETIVAYKERDVSGMQSYRIEIYDQNLLLIDTKTTGLIYQNLIGEGDISYFDGVFAIKNEPSTGYYFIELFDKNLINIGSYKRDDEVIKSSTKRKYRCAVEATFDDPELGVELSPPTWVDIGSVNKYAVLDSNTSQRSIFNAGGFVSCSITEPVDTVGIFGLSGVQSATVSVIDGGSTVYTETKSGMDSEFTNVEVRDIVFSVPPFSNVTIRVDFTGSNVRVGRFAVGVSEAIGRAVVGTELGDIDYSILEFDEFGNTRYVPRPIVSYHTFQVDVAKQKSLSVARKLRSIGGEDAIWSADVGLSEPLVAIGKCERFPITYDNPTIVSYTVKVRGTA